MHCPIDPCWFDHTSNISWRVQIVKILIMKYWLINSLWCLSVGLEPGTVTRDCNCSNWQWFGIPLQTSWFMESISLPLGMVASS
jgi:hypothetical protein